MNEPTLGVVFSPAAVGSDGSFITYQFAPANVVVTGPYPVSYSGYVVASDTD